MTTSTSTNRYDIWDGFRDGSASHAGRIERHTDPPGAVGEDDATGAADASRKMLDRCARGIVWVGVVRQRVNRELAQDDARNRFTPAGRGRAAIRR